MLILEALKFLTQFVNLGGSTVHCVVGLDVPAPDVTKPLSCIADYDCVMVSSHRFTSPLTVVAKIWLTSASNCDHSAWLLAEGHQIRFCWTVLQGFGGSMLGWTGLCGVIPGQAPPASYQDQILSAAICSVPMGQYHWVSPVGALNPPPSQAPLCISQKAL